MSSTGSSKPARVAIALDRGDAVVSSEPSVWALGELEASLDERGISHQRHPAGRESLHSVEPPAPPVTLVVTSMSGGQTGAS